MYRVYRLYNTSYTSYTACTSYILAILVIYRLYELYDMYHANLQTSYANLQLFTRNFYSETVVLTLVRNSRVRLRDTLKLQGVLNWRSQNYIHVHSSYKILTSIKKFQKELPSACIEYQTTKLYMHYLKQRPK